MEPGTQPEHGADPDRSNRGIAPSVKLLCAVVDRLAKVNLPAAVSFVARWRLSTSSVHMRLWAAAARNPALVPAEQVSEFLIGINDEPFWSLHAFPEVAELRAIRFKELDNISRIAIAKRLQKGPPRRLWPKDADPTHVKTGQRYWAVRELKRVELEDGELPEAQKKWLKTNIIPFERLGTMESQEGFPEGFPVMQSVSAGPDSKYDAITGIKRLLALESAFSTSRTSWDDDPAERAEAWLDQASNIDEILNDLESTGNAGVKFPRVWERFGWALGRVRRSVPDRTDHKFQEEVNRILTLLSHLPIPTLSAAIQGISAWMYRRSKQIASAASGFAVWQRVWPVAVDTTNARSENLEEPQSSSEHQLIKNVQASLDQGMLNTLTGMLVRVFLSTWEQAPDQQRPFAANTHARLMRDTIIQATGKSGVIVKQRLVSSLPDFLNTDRQWTEQHLIAPLRDNDEQSLRLWQAVARHTLCKDVLLAIADMVLERAADHRLDRESRKYLVLSLVVESLYAFHQKREPIVSNAQVQQLLRTLDDEIRTHAANVVQEFVKDLFTDDSDTSEKPSASDLFYSAAKPFLREVWPQERSLVTAGVSKAFSELPATTRKAFVEAVSSVERFLMPFDSWSMHEYGFFDYDGAEMSLGFIDCSEKAEAFLPLLDLTIGHSADATIPYDLSDALNQIIKIVPSLAGDQAYRRLATAARR